MQLLTTRNSDVQNPLQDLRYTYDPVGNIVEIYDASKETSYYNNTAIEPRHLYTYDALYRLLSGSGRELLGLAQATSGGYASNSIGVADTRALHTYTQHFAYDELGNIQSIQHQTPTSAFNWTRNYVYDSATNRLLKHDENQTLPDYTYDEHGNMLKMPHLQSMHYDYKDQLDSVMLDASENMAYYLYDAGGQRVRKVVEKGYVREERIYVGGYEVFRRYENSTLDLERSTVHIMDDKNRVALFEKLKVYEGETVSGSEQIRYQYSNHLGSASLELNATGQIISYEEFHPFGTTSYRSGTNETEVSLKRYKYIGKERDEETGLYYYGARYYAAWIGRFVSVDPLASNAPWASPFNAMWNNPIRFVDWDGRWAGDYYRIDENGNPVFVYSDNIDDCKVYVDWGEGNYVLLPDYEDRQYIKNRIESHVSSGPTFNEIGGRITKITEFDLLNMGDPSHDLVFVLNEDYFDGVEFKPNDLEAYIKNELKFGRYKSPKGKDNNQEVLYTWHTHPTGGYFTSSRGEHSYVKPNGEMINMKKAYAEDAMKSSFYVVGGRGPTPGHDKGSGKTLELTFEPRFKEVHVIDSEEKKITLPMDWFFNVKAGIR